MKSRKHAENREIAFFRRDTYWARWTFFKESNKNFLYDIVQKNRLKQWLMRWRHNLECSIVPLPIVPMSASYSQQLESYGFPLDIVPSFVHRKVLAL